MSKCALMHPDDLRLEEAEASRVCAGLRAVRQPWGARREELAFRQEETLPPVQVGEAA